MMKITVRSDGFEGYKKRALARAAKLARREPIRPEMTITFDNPLSMLEVLTAERIRLCETARRKSLSISALATELNRDPKSVRRDVLKLESAGVVRLHEQINPGHGRVRIVEPTAKRFELIASF
jgi:predicted transcriptional regulator